MYKFVVLSLLVASAFAIPAPESQNLDCLKNEEDMFSCWGVKAAIALERAARSADLKIIDGVTFVRDTPMERSGKSLKPETEVLKELPRDAADRTLEIGSMIYESAMSFLKSHSLKLDMPEGSAARALTEGRAKIKKMILPIVAVAAAKLFALAPILLGGLALLVAKALFVGKVALLLAGIIAFQRLFNGGSIGSIGSGFGSNFFAKNPTAGWYDNNQGWSGSQTQGYYRSFTDDKVGAQKLAYNYQAPSTNEAH